MGEVRFFQKNDTDFRFLPSIQVKNQRKCSKDRRNAASDPIVTAEEPEGKFWSNLPSMAACKPMAASDHLNKLSPFIDDQNLIQLKGLQRHADASYGMKHPILLSAKHPILRKLIEDAHETNYHEGTEYVRSILQQNYWKIGLRNALRIVKLKCVKCRKQQVGEVQPLMADLPRERLEERLFPFANTGVAYFGPFEVRFMRRSVKRWCCLYICLTTRAVRIEVVPSLEANACLAARCHNEIRRTKRETNIMLSDNETNSVGATREMREWIEAWNQSNFISKAVFNSKANKMKVEPPMCAAFWRCLGTNGQRLQESYDGNSGK